MSADLFAAFDGPSQPPNQGQKQQQNAAQAKTQANAFSSDPFAFLSSAAQSPVVSQTQPFPSFPSTNNDPWGSFAGGQGIRQPAKAEVNDDNDDNDDDDDGWGDFETADPIAPPAPKLATAATPIPASTKPPPQNPAIQRTRIIRAPTIELMTNSLIDIPGTNVLPEEVRSPPWMRQSFDRGQKSTPPPAAKPIQPVQQPQRADPNVLFDADEFDGKVAEDDDDDFGDFETVASPAPAPAASSDLLSDDLFSPPPTARPTSTTKRMNTADLLSSLTLDAPASPYPQAPKSPAFRDRNPFPGLGLKTPTEPEPVPKNEDAKTATPLTAWPSFDNDSTKTQTARKTQKINDGWDAFDSLAEEPAASKEADTANDDWGEWDAFDNQKSEPVKAQATGSTERDDVSTWAWNAIDNPNDKSVDTKADSAPPINIPPPSVLLSIFPQLLAQANDSLFKPVSGKSTSIKNRILSDPKTVDFLRGYLLLATVAARIIAGRKQRWHRDKFLSQSMSISAAGSKGMKLAGVDKTQAIREDREAADVLDLWKEHVGRLRSAVAAANQSIKDASQQLKIPELRDNMQAQTAKGVLTAPKACVICGIKRDERLARVDFDVEDSFGEWWTEHWGHTACKRFWLKHESALRQR
ncbi:hypothetical protein PFICI_08300 [Pestalotiopsis fici W106-1]|uniref:Serine/threonine-protein kinase ppk6 n=1 Tax=Pestalotiopsis fici (strain W106-1 / CGMCC3.15140) TaxID=1229662 RepID=W3X6I1_PESFW|nr:uncharacterized protein PFICI_08300 [Pestalotiopsis fici W106-1]ETS80771.1 hypothetical protein PFICI_08300 [Pestalotiopsis fici W106-1]